MHNINAGYDLIAYIKNNVSFSGYCCLAIAILVLLTFCAEDRRTPYLSGNTTLSNLNVLVFGYWYMYVNLLSCITIKNIVALMSLSKVVQGILKKSTK